MHPWKHIIFYPLQSPEREKVVFRRQQQLNLNRGSMAPLVPEPVEHKTIVMETKHTVIRCCGLATTFAENTVTQECSAK